MIFLTESPRMTSVDEVIIFKLKARRNLDLAKSIESSISMWEVLTFLAIALIQVSQILFVAEFLQ